MSITTLPRAETTLLDGALGYLLKVLDAVRPADLTSPTPCSEWDLTTLLAHLDDSLVVLGEAGHGGRVKIQEPPPFVVSVDGVVSRIADHAAAARATWALGGPGMDSAMVGGCPLSAGLVVATGALEVAVHGWDVTKGCGVELPVPESLAGQLLAAVPDLVSSEDRPARFAAALPVCPWTPASERLLALVGRCVAWRHHART